VRDTLKKAYVLILDGKKKGTTIPVLFNPTEYSVDQGATFQSASLPGLDSPILQYVSGTGRTLSLELFFDTYGRVPPEPVTKYTQPIVDLVKVDGSLHAPSPIKLVWGTSLDLTAVVEKVGQKYTTFLDDGTPVRATLTVSLKEYLTVSDQLSETPRESADVVKSRIVERGDALWRIAAEEYGGAEHWRVLADANELDDPLDLTPGQVLLIPRLP
jgi:nucleoid-associated protein YgaU